MNKVIESSEIRKFFKSGYQILTGGFGLSGTPLTIIDELLETDISDLTIVSNNLGDNRQGLHKLFMQGKIKKAIGSFFTINREPLLLGLKASWKLNCYLKVH